MAQTGSPKVLGQVRVSPSHQRRRPASTMPSWLEIWSRICYAYIAIQDLNLLAKVAEVRQGPDDLGDITAQFPALFPQFSGLGTLKGEFHIRLKPDAIPYALHTPKIVPLPFHKKVKEELVRMESLGVISKVDVPTPWCVGMVVVPKKDGTVRICVDLKPLNTAVLHEPHSLPFVLTRCLSLSPVPLISSSNG